MNNDDWNQHLRALEEAHRSGRAVVLAVLAALAGLAVIVALILAAVWPGTVATAIAFVAAVALAATFLYGVIFR